MKKCIAFFMSIILACSLAGCGDADAKSGNADTADTTGNTASAQTELSDPEDSAPPAEPADSQVAEDTTAGSGSDILIVYFSIPEDVDPAGADAVAGASIVVRDGEKQGNTEFVAKIVQQTVGGDLFRIEWKNFKKEFSKL